MKKVFSLFALMVVALFAQVALAGPGCGGHGKHGPMAKAGIAVENTKDGVKVIVTAADPADVQAIQDHFAKVKEARDKGEKCPCGMMGEGAGEGKGCGCGDAKCDCEKGKCDCAKEGKGCGCGCDKDAKAGEGCGCGMKKDAKAGEGCGCGMKKDAKAGEGCGCGMKKDAKAGEGCGCGMNKDAKPGEGCGCPLALCALDGISLLVENTIDGAVLNVAGPDPAKIQKHFEGKARPVGKKGGCGCGGK